jgi:hypothetical protein
MEPVSDGCLHQDTFSPALRATLRVESALTLCHITMASIYFDADDRYRQGEGCRATTGAHRLPA